MNSSANTPKNPLAFALSYWVLDRFEGNEALLIHDTGSRARLDRRDLPAEVHEGSCLQWIRDAWIIDTAETERRKNAYGARLRNLFRKGQKETP